MPMAKKYSKYKKEKHTVKMLNKSVKMSFTFAKNNVII